MKIITFNLMALLLVFLPATSGHASSMVFERMHPAPNDFHREDIDNEQKVFAVIQQVAPGVFCIVSTVGRPELVPFFLETAVEHSKESLAVLNSMPSLFCTDDEREIIAELAENFEYSVASKFQQTDMNKIMRVRPLNIFHWFRSVLVKDGFLLA